MYCHVGREGVEWPTENMASWDGTGGAAQAQQQCSPVLVAADEAKSTVSMRCDQPFDARIRYTTDSSDPTNSSTARTFVSCNPPKLTGTARLTVNAVAVRQGWEPSIVVAETFDMQVCPDVSMVMDAGA